ncbi:hypothetical protein [Alkalihalobacillus sp. LMS39]|uniref:hypothetical protein n=1 Tax=Alkalihalobacillus sp. LMS39 TaxID=2924032 RepID=UPI001FB2783F|nr:hypothetical protein [Alkalihalobacillus sp. LMS39]UOE93170.1 hypothetical protein MM271_18475 [Alkalihalobacillus sp. LMS39]
MIAFPYPEYHRLIDEVVLRMYEAFPELHQFGEKGKQKCREDNEHHFHHLETAYQLDSEKIFVDYAEWLNGILLRHGMKTNHLIDNFERIAVAITGNIVKEKEEKFQLYIHQAIQVLRMEKRRNEQV